MLQAFVTSFQAPEDKSGRQQVAQDAGGNAAGDDVHILVPEISILPTLSICPYLPSSTVGRLELS